MSNNYIFKETKDLMPDYTIQEDYLNEAIHCQNLLDGFSILGNYETTKLILDSVSAQINLLEQEIAIASTLTTICTEMELFLNKHRDKFKTFILKNEIERFTLEDNESFNDDSINWFKYEDKNIYDGTFTNWLYEIRKKSVEVILDKAIHVKKLEVIQYKLEESISDGYYLQGKDEIKENFFETYDKLNYDKLIKASENNITHTDLDDISNSCVARNRIFLDNLSPRSLTSYVARNLDTDCYIHFVIVRKAIKYLKEQMQ